MVERWCNITLKCFLAKIVLLQQHLVKCCCTQWNKSTTTYKWVALFTEAMLTQVPLWLSWSKIATSLFLFPHDYETKSGEGLYFIDVQICFWKSDIFPTKGRDRFTTTLWPKWGQRSYTENEDTVRKPVSCRTNSCFSFRLKIPSEHQCCLKCRVLFEQLNKANVHIKSIYFSERTLVCGELTHLICVIKLWTAVSVWLVWHANNSHSGIWQVSYAPCVASGLFPCLVI